MMLFDTRRAAIAATIAPEEHALQTFGYDAIGDRGGGLYVRLGAPPPHPVYFTSADGGFWALTQPEPTIECFGGFASPTKDVTPALNDFQKYAAATGRFRVHLTGVYYAKSRPAEFNIGLKLIGKGRSHTALLRDYAPASPLEGFLYWHSLVGRPGVLGGGVYGMSINATQGATGVMVKAVTDGPIAGHFTMQDIAISYNGAGGWTRGVYLDGVANTAPGGPGWRDITFNDIYVFKPPGAESIRFNGCVNFWGDCWVAGPFIITGSPDVHSIYGNVVIASNDQLFLSNADLVTTVGHVNNLTYSTGTTRCRHYGSVPINGYGNAGAASNGLI